MEIGRVTDDGMLRVLHHGRVAAEIPAHALAEEGPRYERPIAAPKAPAASGTPLVEFCAAGTDLTENFRRLLAAPAIASKRWICEQYDSHGAHEHARRPGRGRRGSRAHQGIEARARAFNRRQRPLVLSRSPKLGAMLAVAEAARNVACSGARPMAATNCLNFGNPEKPEVMWQFSRGD